MAVNPLAYAPVLKMLHPVADYNILVTWQPAPHGRKPEICLKVSGGHIKPGKEKAAGQNIFIRLRQRFALKEYAQQGLSEYLYLGARQIAILAARQNVEQGPCSEEAHDQRPQAQALGVFLELCALLLYFLIVVNHGAGGTVQVVTR